MCITESLCCIRETNIGFCWFFMFFFFNLNLKCWLLWVSVAVCGLSLVAVCRLSCLEACGILFLEQGVKPASPALEGGFLTTEPPGKPPNTTLLINYTPI